MVGPKQAGGVPRVSLGGAALALAIVAMAAVIATGSAQAQTFTELYAFTGTPDGSDPGQSNLLDVNGGLYGTTDTGGAYGYGSVFDFSDGKETILYSFTGGTDGAAPYATLVRDLWGNLYGTTLYGGDAGCSVFGSTGCGVVYKLTPTGAFSVLYTFTGTDGAVPQGVVLDLAGNLYGATLGGGDLSCGIGGGCGVLYKLNPWGNETVLYTFTLGTGGAVPNGFVNRDISGTLYGATVYGGNLADCSGIGCGVVYKLDTSSNETVLYTFTGATDGSTPNSDLLLDLQGNLYGTASSGGDLSCNNSLFFPGCGVVFEVTPAGKEIVLHTFTGPDGANPSLGLVSDLFGNLYSTTIYGGADNLGTVFEVAAGGGEKVLYSFTGSTDGALPFSGLTIDLLGNLYGNTAQGGDLSCNSPSGCGTLFKVNPYLK
jgi:uncharacterized repeat protein (TIGR03803 family)